MGAIGQQTFGLEHPLVTVKDHAKVLKSYVAMGFKPTPISFHPWGTVTSLVLFPGNFIEIIGVNDVTKFGTNSVNGFCFGRQLGSFLESGNEGISFVALHSKNADQDNQFLEQQGLIGQGRIDFRRKMKLPDGTPDEAVVSLGLFIDKQNPGVSNFICHQHRPELIWVKDWQTHPNGADKILSVTYVGDPKFFKDRWSKIYGNSVSESDGIVRADTGCGDFIAMSIEKAKQLFGVVGLPDSEFSKPQAIAMSIHTNMLSTTKEILLRNEIDFVEYEGRLVVKPEFAGNTILEFVSDF